MGVGATERASAVRWGLSVDIFVAWVVTLPAAALIGGACALAARAIFAG
jgi:PiT family inorganic phosphate transporter